MGGRVAMEQVGEVLAGKAPFEGLRQGHVSVLKAEDLVGESIEVVEVVGCQNFALEDGEVDFDLVQPTRVDRGEDRVQVGPGPLETPDGTGASVGGAVVEDPEHPRGGAVRLLAHDVGDEAVERGDAVAGFAPSKESGAPHVPGGEVDQRALSFVFVFQPVGPAGGGGVDG